jgi:hypothetical protein
MVECFKVGLYWRGLAHDLSKFLPSEYIPYMNHFYGKDSHHKDGNHMPKGIKKGRDETGYYNPTDTGDKAFDFAWLLHQKRNRHHWQWWVLPEDDGGLKILPMPYSYCLEMVCDWVGAGKAQGFWSPKDDKYFETRSWYRKNSCHMQIHEKTKKFVEAIITEGGKRPL